MGTLNIGCAINSARPFQDISLLRMLCPEPNLFRLMNIF
jgi:hypothetical protein